MKLTTLIACTTGFNLAIVNAVPSNPAGNVGTLAKRMNCCPAGSHCSDAFCCNDGPGPTGKLGHPVVNTWFERLKALSVMS